MQQKRLRCASIVQRLSTDVRLHIMTFLPVTEAALVQRVCTGWRVIKGRHKVLDVTVTQAKQWFRGDADVANALFRTWAGAIEQLDVQGNGMEFARHAARHFGMLRSLSVRGWPMRPETWRLLLAQCPRLTDLGIYQLATQLGGEANRLMRASDWDVAEAKRAWTGFAITTGLQPLDASSATWLVFANPALRVLRMQTSSHRCKVYRADLVEFCRRSPNLVEFQSSFEPVDLSFDDGLLLLLSDLPKLQQVSWREGVCPARRRNPLAIRQTAVIKALYSRCTDMACFPPRDIQLDRKEFEVIDLDAAACFAPNQLTELVCTRMWAGIRDPPYVIRAADAWLTTSHRWRRLELHCVEPLGDEALAHVASCCTQLVSLTVVRASSTISTGTWMALAKLPALTEICFGGSGPDQHQNGTDPAPPMSTTGITIDVLLAWLCRPIRTQLMLRHAILEAINKANVVQLSQLTTAAAPTTELFFCVSRPVMCELERCFEACASRYIWKNGDVAISPIPHSCRFG